jgi:hypothetical protein
MGYGLAVLIIIGVVAFHLASHGATLRPARFRHTGGVGILSLAGSAFQTAGNRRRLLRKLNRVVLQGWRDLVVDFTDVEPCGSRGSIDPLRTFLDEKVRPDGLHMVLVSPDPEVRASYRLGPLPSDVPVVKTVAEGLDYLEEHEEKVAPV